MSEQTILPEPASDASFQSQYARVFEAAECKTQSELAELFGIKQSSISDDELLTEIVRRALKSIG